MMIHTNETRRKPTSSKTTQEVRPRIPSRSAAGPSTSCRLGPNPGRIAALVAVVSLALYGCAGDEGSGGGRGELLGLNAPLEELVWNSTAETLYGIGEGGGWSRWTRRC